MTTSTTSYEAYLPHELALVLLVLFPSSAAAAPEVPRPMVLFEVEVDVEPALSVWRELRADLVPVGRAAARDAVRMRRRAVGRILSVGWSD